MSIHAEKVALRKRVRVLKLGMTQMEMEEEAVRVFLRVEEQACFQEATTVLCYWSMYDELPTQAFISRWCGKKRILLPVVQGDNLLLKEYTGEACLQRMPPYGIQEPVDTPEVPGREVDVAIVPGVAFDAQGHRLGRGRGFYDRVFKSMPRATLIGVGLSIQEVPRVPTESHDRAMAMVIVPDGVRQPA